MSLILYDNTTVDRYIDYFKRERYLEREVCALLAEPASLVS